MLLKGDHSRIKSKLDNIFKILNIGLNHLALNPKKSEGILLGSKHTLNEIFEQNSFVQGTRENKNS